MASDASPFASRRRRCRGLVALATATIALGCPAAALAAGARSAAASVLPAGAGPAAALPTISPLPGTPDASPRTQISILGVARRMIEGVRVTGSVSGVHAGRLRAYSNGQGASFLLDRALTEGERVAVVVRLRCGRRARSHFTVARLAPIPGVLDIPHEQPDKLDHFVSEPALLAPRVTITQHLRTGGGDIFLTPLPSPIIHPESNNELTVNPVGPGGPMIVSPSGRLIWFDPLAPPSVATNFRPQHWHGHEVLTWWQGGVTPIAYGLGEGVIADARYRTVQTVHTGNGYQADLHEFLLTRGGQALFTVDSPVLVHLPGTAPGAKSPLLDSIVQEVDVQTGLVMWEWHAFGHIPLRDSYATPGNNAAYDAFHLNSIQQLCGGRLLVSARDTSAIYDIDQRTGRIAWTLGGRASTFRLGRGARFYFQHDATMLPGDRVSLFDDGAGPPTEEATSRGLVLALHPRHRLATVVRQYHRPGHDTSANSEGNVQTLPSRDVFIGFGSTPYFSQFSASGRLQLDGALPVDDGSYRVFRFPWHATPTTPPVAVAHRTGASAVTIWVSWNGATTVRRWQVLARSASGSLRPIKTVPDRSFETQVTVDTAADTFELRALGSRGQVLGRSAPVTPS